MATPPDTAPEIKPDIELVPCSAAQLETLIDGAEAFSQAYGYQVAEGYMPFAGALQYILQQMQTDQLWHPWLPYLFVFRPAQALVGLGGFKFPPDAQRTVEIGYSVAPAYQGKGVATAAARQLVQIAFDSPLVDCVCAHTLAEHNASTRVLKKCGLRKVADREDPDVGSVWRWEITRP